MVYYAMLTLTSLVVVVCAWLWVSIVDTIQEISPIRSLLGRLFLFVIAVRVNNAVNVVAKVLLWVSCFLFLDAQSPCQVRDRAMLVDDLIDHLMLLIESPLLFVVSHCEFGCWRRLSLRFLLLLLEAHPI